MNTRPDTDKRPALRDGSMRQILCLLGLFGGLIFFYAGGAGVQLDEVYDLQYLHDHTWYEILLTPKFGYFSLVHNIVFTAQKLLPDVPLHVFKYATGLAIEALLFILVVHTTSPFKTWFERAVFLAMSLLMLENIYDSSFWQFYLAAACLLILFSENNRRYG